MFHLLLSKRWHLLPSFLILRTLHRSTFKTLDGSNIRFLAVNSSWPQIARLNLYAVCQGWKENRYKVCPFPTIFALPGRYTVYKQSSLPVGLSTERIEKIEKTRVTQLIL
jgi:hypothetical protein